MRKITRACGSQARTPAAALALSWLNWPRAPMRVRWSGGRLSHAPANSITSTFMPSQSEIIAPSRCADRGRIANKPA